MRQRRVYLKYNDDIIREYNTTDSFASIRKRWSKLYPPSKFKDAIIIDEYGNTEESLLSKNKMAKVKEKKKVKVNRQMKSIGSRGANLTTKNKYNTEQW